ncbi:CoA ester lyase [Tsuneonella sp. CC-YZS046]|uniref:HpcH/HpaI aldolase/citrate lyase family protein n=1 Tax=Tsuneonella sp. CC-YZS046 TaxID=3042152 RepID=UPI002D774BAF|nr:CoA ester lyase [Tsuneonella sp. CC-YZS046]WRO66503.1 CoA ester lyase [Tsuneonella sp. CC-YZS046]
MRLRSLLFVPGDSDKKFAKARESGADVLILDLEDSVAPSMKDTAREMVQGWLDQAGEVEPALFVRINPLDTGLTLADLSAVVRPGLAGILVPKANGAHDIERIGHYLDALEQRSGIAPGTVKIAVVSTETPAAMFALGSYQQAGERLVGLTWGAEDLGAAIGITDNKEPDGSWTFPYQVARAQCLFAAAAAGVAPLDTLYANFKDPEGLEADCRRARRDGFTGRVAIHPAQVETINSCFSPSEEEVAFARRVVDAFAANPDAGTLGIDGKMVDIPHLVAARKTLAAAGEA